MDTIVAGFLSAFIHTPVDRGSRLNKKEHQAAIDKAVAGGISVRKQVKDCAFYHRNANATYCAAVLIVRIMGLARPSVCPSVRHKLLTRRQE